MTNIGRRAAAFMLFALVSVSGLAQHGTQAGPASKPAPPPAPVAAAADPGDWPMYGHDLQRTNTNLAERLIAPGNIASLVPRWQVNIGTNRNASSSGPVVANGRVYLGSSASRGPNFFAFAAITGAPVFSTSVGYMTNCFGVGIGSTAAISGSMVVVGGGDAAYYGLDANSGAQLWRDPLNVGPSGFAWESPLLVGNRAYLGIASDCDDPSVRGEIRAVDLATGSMLANQYFVPSGQAGGGIWNSPALSPDGGTLVVTTGEDQGPNQPYTRALVTLDPLSLAIRASNQQGPTNSDYDFATSPVIFHDSQGRLLSGASHKDNHFYIYDLNHVDSGPLWQPLTGFLTGMMPAYDASYTPSGVLISGTSNGALFALDPDTGTYRWYGRAGMPAPFGNIAIANGLIFVNRGPSGLDIVDETNGNVLRTLVPANAGEAYSGVAVAHGFLYWVSGAYLNAWSLPPDWPTPTPVPPTSTPIPPTPTIGPGCLFSDVCPSDYFFTPVQYLVQRGAISGYGDNTFRPYANTTRAQGVKIVDTAFAIAPYTPPTPTFLDVPIDHPFFSYIESAAHARIISGYGDGTFHPDNLVGRGQLAKIVVTAAGVALVSPPSATFADVLPGSAFYSFVETAACHGVISGYACGEPGEPCAPQDRKYFRPDAPATRGQVGKIVYGALTSSTSCPPPGPGK